MAKSQNRFLSSLSQADLGLLTPHLRTVQLSRGKLIFEQGHEIERLYFPVNGAVSFLVVMTEGELVEAGMIGTDGVVGSSAALNGSKAINTAIVQVALSASVIDASQMRAAVAASPALRTKLYQHDQLLLAQAQQSAACNALHHVEERLCRWLLRTRDLVESNILEITQEFLSQMLGVRRTSVTLTARRLQSLGLIKYRRARIEIIDPDGLKETSCECYESFRTQQQRLLESH